MEKGRIITADSDIRRILETNKTVAVLGLSPKPARDSHKVAAFLREKGYRIIPVRPAQKRILGETAYPDLDALDQPVDILDVFRNSQQVPEHVEAAIRLKPKVFWMQLGIENQQAARQLGEAGIDVIMNRCIKVEYVKHFGK